MTKSRPDQLQDCGDNSQNDTQIETCEVTKFALDENFDYDHVPLTQKFDFPNKDSASAR